MQGYSSRRALDTSDCLYLLTTNKPIVRLPQFFTKVFDKLALGLEEEHFSDFSELRDIEIFRKMHSIFR